MLFVGAFGSSGTNLDRDFVPDSPPVMLCSYAITGTASMILCKYVVIVFILTFAR